jgi:hypothetical protein
VFAIGVGWFAVNLTFGVILYTLEAPFYRFFFSIIPIPFLIGMGICGLLLYAEGHLSHAVAEVPVATNEPPPSNQFVRWGSAHLNARKLGIGLAALAAGVVGIILVADSGRAVVERFSAVSNAPVEMTANDVATYIAAAKPQGEVVLVYPGTRLQDMLGAPVFADAARAASPNAAIGVYIGPGPDALASRPPRAATNNGTYEGVRSAISADAWQTTGPGMQDATLLVDRSMLAAQPELFDHLARQYPGGLITPGLLVLRGPVVAISASTQGFPTISKWRLLLIVLVLIGLMASIGGGVAFLAAHGAPIGTVLALSPACGVGVSLVATFTAALARTDPAGPIAGVLVLLLSVIAYVLAWRTHGAERASEKA